MSAFVLVAAAPVCLTACSSVAGAEETREAAPVPAPVARFLLKKVP